MAEKFTLGDRVTVVGKDLRGQVGFIGETDFSPGKWYGLILDEPKGKNNGTVQGRAYFECEENHGLFIRESQLQAENTTLAPPKTTSKLVSPRSSLRMATPRSSKLPGLTAKTTSRIPSAPSGLSSMGSTTKRTSREMPSPRLGTARKSRYGTGGTLAESSSAESLGAVSIRSESSETAKSITKIEELEEKASTLSTQSSILQTLSEENRSLKMTVEDLEAQLNIMKELVELRDNLEMAYLDKEMAEEKIEELQTELDRVRDEAEALRTELEILKAERETEGLEETEDVPTSSVANKALEDQNVRLREALVGMRDLSAQERHKTLKLERICEDQRKEIDDMTALKDKLEANVEEVNKQLLEALDQMSAYMGSEKIIDNLTTKVLGLEEELEETREKLLELERDSAITQELVEAQSEAEKEFRDEIATLQTTIAKMKRVQDEMKNLIADRDSTILKFRDLVSQLHEKIEQISRDNADKDREIEESTATIQAMRSMGASAESVEYKMKLEQSRGKKGAFEIEMRILEADLAGKHVYYLSKFVPANFMQRGGDHDAILLLLLIPRLMRKCEMLHASAKQNFFMSPESFSDVLNSAQALLKEPAVDRASFGHRLSRLVLGITGILRQCSIAMDHCSVDAFVRLAAFYPEFSVQEKTIDVFVELLRRDQLDENVPLEGAERAFIQLCQLLHGSLTEVINTGREKPLRKRDDIYSWLTDSLWLQDSARTFQSAVEAILMEVSRIKCLMLSGSETTEMGLFLKEIHGDAEETRNALRKIARFLPADGESKDVVALDKGVREIIKSSHGRVDLLVLAFQDISKACVRQILSSGGADPSSLGLTSEKVKELAFVAVENASHKSLVRFLNSEDSDASFVGPLVMLKKFMSGVRVNATDIATNLAQGKYDMSLKPDESATDWKNVTSPLELRAVMIKEEMKDAENLRTKLEMRDQDIKDLKKLLKQKQEEMSELAIRRDMAEKKLLLVSQEKQLSEERWTRRLEDAQALIAKKEKECAEIVDQLQKDVDTSENEKQQLKARLLAVNKFQALEGESILFFVRNFEAGLGKIGTPGSPTSSVPPMSLPAMASTALTAGMSPLAAMMSQSPGRGSMGGVHGEQIRVLEEERDALRRLVRVLEEKNASMVVDDMKNKMLSLKPLVVPKKRGSGGPEDRLDELQKQTHRLLDRIFKESVLPVIDITKRHGQEIHLTELTWPGAELLERQRNTKKLRDELEDLRSQSLDAAIRAEVGGRMTESTGAVFGRPLYTKALLEKRSSSDKETLVARLTVPKSVAQRMNLPIDEPVKRIRVDGREWAELMLRLGPGVC
ncbi:unnamed protein product [Notodromas monacha]|uniref:Dynactin subunit 1 n=1 Tax=Notodromas monacha TaxID=399045 RepID=A0A7R9BLC5_9CRUS|nr:unnamed protein product [Notodromas monacha]CAG0917339.1 unnamed protein product [Notodromas monacha]